MKKSRIVVLFVASLALASAGCLTSLHPWFTQDDLVFEPALIGTWQDVASPDVTWTFERKDDTTYTLIDTRNQDEPRKDSKAAAKKPVTSRLTARLMRLGQQRFLDISAGDEWSDSEMLQSLLVNSHAVAKVSLEGDTLSTAFLDGDWIETALGDKRIVLSHEVVDASGAADDPPTRIHSSSRRVILTAPTGELRTFLTKHANTAGAFQAGEQMRRRRPVK